LEWSKLKSIIILLLLLSNLFLLVLVGGRAQQRATALEEMKKSTISYLQKSGITLSEDMVPWEKSCQVFMTERNQAEEERIASFVLKEINGRSLGAAVEYSGVSGTVRFYQDGRFLILLREGQPIKDSTELTSYAAKYLNGLGLRVELYEVKQEGDRVRVSFLQTLEELPIFTCKIDMEYEEGSLVKIQGWRLLGEATVDHEEKGGLTAATLLFRFVEEMKKENIEYKEIRSITQGFVYSTGSLSSQAKLLPVWRIETDKGQRILNCTTGKFEALSTWMHEL